MGKNEIKGNIENYRSKRTITKIKKDLPSKHIYKIFSTFGMKCTESAHGGSEATLVLRMPTF